MDRKEIIEFLHHIETKYPVSSWSVNGINVWPLIRVTIGNLPEKIIKKRSDTASRNSLRKWFQWGMIVWSALVGELKLFICDYRHQQKLERKDFVVFGDAIDRNILLPSGAWMDHNLDPIQDQLEQQGYSVFRFEKIGNARNHNPRWGKSYPIDGLIVKILIKRRLWNRSASTVDVKMERYDSFLQEVESFFNGKIEELRLSNVILQAVNLVTTAIIFAKQIKKINPRLVILKDWYDRMALVYAVHLLHIPVVEIQHGVVHNSFAYSNWANLPSSGYELMPDYVWVWNQSDYEEIARWGKTNMVPFIGGSPNNIIWSYYDSAFFKAYQKEYDSMTDSHRQTLLFSLQWLFDYPEWLLDIINNTKEYTWLIRLHPCDSDGQRSFLRRIKKQENIKWEMVDKIPIAVLLQNVSLHITMSSAIVEEGEFWGCPSIIMHPDGKTWFARQIQNGIARYADNYEELLKAIKDILSKGGGREKVEKQRTLLQNYGQMGINKLIEIVEV